ncbi:MAG: RNA pseudouridine synthase [Alistipes sp.]|nr:RNA pseudouridine synthase [Alistipes sp.]
MLHRFRCDISAIALPAQFTWPFHYTPHPLCRMATDEVQAYLRSREEWQEEIAAGKMFGVLVVQQRSGDVGFLAAFSGNLSGRNDHEYFVPAVYDMLQPDDFFRREEAEISAINRRIADVEQSEEYCSAKQAVQESKLQAEQEIATLKKTLAQRKAERAQRRAEGEDEAQLILESQRDNADMQRLKRHCRAMVAQAEERFALHKAEIDALRAERSHRSAELQMALFREFRMLNARGEVRDLCDLFAPTAQRIPPAGAGECAAPKLLQYAYLHDLRPLAMAEFWQGASPRGEVRHDGHFYPSCNSKCKPILMHMMQGLDVEPNPLVEICPPEPQVLLEDESVVVIDKPCGMLSVDGKSGVRSVQAWARERYGEKDFPMIVHRLDQSTSGILILAKSKAAHYALQSQFIHRTVEKHYVALLEGEVAHKSGMIDLPMRLDYDNRPRQMISSDGKQATTEYEVLGIKDGRTRILFRPITGRTHQLRLHAAHCDGLNTPIVGDDIYGRGLNADCTAGHRLYLHACLLEFDHPVTGERIKVECKADF